MFYRLMGWVAFSCARMSRYRVNGIPSHFWIVFACLTALVIGGDVQLRDAAVYGKPPVSMTLPQALAGGALNQYVSISGALDSRTTLVGKGNGDQDLYEPMADPKTRQALLVKRLGSALPASAALTSTVTGVFRQLPSDLYSHLKDSGFSLGPYTVSTGFELDEGDKPIDPRSYLITLFVAGLPLTLILLSIARKHVIFQRSPRTFGAAGRDFSAPAQDSAALPAMRLSGRLRLGPKTAQRFLEVSGMWTQTEAGQEMFVSRINNSVKRVDGSVQDRIGLWVAVIEDGSLRVEDEGTLFLGRSARPAFRIRYTDISGPKPARSVAVLSFENEAERAALLEKLQQAGRQTAGA